MAINLTGKKPLFGNKRSHALNTTKKKQGLNLQSIKLEDGTKIRLAAREIKTLKKDVKTVTE
ncbi:MAG: L28 family ribosomal protein [Bacilli bacterium]